MLCLMRREQSKRGALIWLWLSGLLIVCDQLSKWLVMQHLAPGQVLPVFSWFNVAYRHNAGAAFSLLANAGGWQVWALAIFALLVCVFMLGCLARIPQHDRLLAFGLSSVMGGAAGNVIDRVRWGHVIDWIDWHWQGYHWATFNLADSAICVGVLAMLLKNFGTKRCA